jgi:hypothetical protein
MGETRVDLAHPAYRRAAAVRSEGSHLALALPLAVEPTERTRAGPGVSNARH